MPMRAACSHSAPRSRASSPDGSTASPSPILADATAITIQMPEYATSTPISPPARGSLTTMRSSGPSCNSTSSGRQPSMCDNTSRKVARATPKRRPIAEFGCNRARRRSDTLSQLPIFDADAKRNSVGTSHTYASPGAGGRRISPRALARS
ncbi:hypothetical protein [Candidatus Burkholderia verschuerenii]|uniref:hypothetical protein n=1 Tax=Candidatus Burkholderia verschuerenii TaxID=242163 RepID=UPI0012ED086C|nr:hypothetical protein [Candidatus Burkholderia verschuerenii]